MAHEAFIHLENIIKRYPGAVALDGVSMDFYPGRIHAVIGENGAGKTTLMWMIDGLCVPDSGHIVVDGQSMEPWNTAMARRHGIAMVHQHFTLIPEMTVVENVLLAGGRSLPVRLRKAEAVGRIERLCAEYGFDLRPQSQAGSLSPGQKQRAEIIKALYYQCRMLILDEPTAVLTGGEVSRLFDVLRKLAAEGTSVVLISHKLDEVFEVCDVITVLRRGTVAGSCCAGEMSAEQVAGMMTAREAALETACEPIQEPTCGVGHEHVCKSAQENEIFHDAGQHAGKCGADVFSECSGKTGISERISGEGVPPVLEIRNLYVAGNGGRENRPELDGISLSLSKGEIYGIAGVDGNGQSGLTAALLGLAPRLGRGERPDAPKAATIQTSARQADAAQTDAAHAAAIQAAIAPSSEAADRKLQKCRGRHRRGVIFINGEDVTTATTGQILERGVAYIPEDCQETGIVREMTVEENLILNSFRKEKYGRRFWMNWGAVRRETVRAIGDLNIRAYSGKQTVGTLSGGNQQKLVVARELGKKPGLIIASNPTRGIDANGAQKIRSEFLKASRSGCAILLISADLDELLYLADRIGVMYEGKIIAEFPGVKATAYSEKALREQIGLAMANISGTV